MKISFIGVGNMATAIIKGILNGLVSPDEVFGFDKHPIKLNALCDRNGIHALDSAKEAAISADVVLLAVKPKDLPALLEEIGKELQANDPLLISIAAGTTITDLEGWLPYQPRRVRIMPNINATVGEAMSAYCPNARVSKDEEGVAAAIAGAIGKVIRLDESYFSAFVALAGSAPAFAYRFIDTLANAGVELGLPKALALDIAAQTVYGSAKMLAESDLHPQALIDNVCSPGGTTIAGMSALREYGFDHAAAQAVLRAYRRDREMQEGK